VAFEDLADRIVIVELDEDIAALWQTMLSEDNDWLAQQVLDFNLTLESLRTELSQTPQDTKHLAFHTLLRNRTYHGGILANGSGILKYGENGRGIRSRWYPGTLYKRIQNIKMVRSKVMFIHGDGIRVIREYAAQKTAVFFIDPPYTAAGKRAGRRLYPHSELDHEELFSQAESIRGDFLMTYDNAKEVKAMATQHGFATRNVPMMNTHHATMHELLIGRDLSWV
jgi:DNA adenine methylase